MGNFQRKKRSRRGKAGLVIVAKDASDNTKKLFRNMCAFYEVPYYEYAVKEDLGRCIGKQYRASLAVTDSGFAKALESKILSGEKIE